MQEKLVRISAVTFFYLLASSAFGSPDCVAQNGQFNTDYFDQSLSCPGFQMTVRVRHPSNCTGSIPSIHVVKGGAGGDEAHTAYESVGNDYASAGYVTVHLETRKPGFFQILREGAVAIAKKRGPEIDCAVDRVADGTIDLSQQGITLMPDNQGCVGHSGGSFTCLAVAGTNQDHGDYTRDAVKAVNSWSPAGDEPDQFGYTPPTTFDDLDIPIYIIVGEEELDTNGTGKFMATDWRLQPFQKMPATGTKYQSLMLGPDTTHSDIGGTNDDQKLFNVDNGLAFFDTYLRAWDREVDIGQLSPTPGGSTFSTK